ncbi:phosphopantetheine-binding protein [Brevibacillus laterosporus]|uniref:phosphopantetheine-binding protein n=1 Tax=Brevibacillus laterosporus TaxID=1465 RepID=UPI000CE38AA9|nr:phosphopantetheine-binding protein [Brevibacillus laterosporus]MED1663210.1 phosphopantetheine-binding protein [Brevibacillus laterosporus]MED1669577.1 phosphopantetheine-binding protein [Brevibacillus laterosporus]MED1718875.1 phosphopantetheine-binding protein [Brevibacillus laterosporus]PPA89263.1 acyl carrier protein [Brevibacillus laterosporus]
MTTQEKVRHFIESNLVIFDDHVEFSDEDNIFELGFVNSLFAMKMLTFVEEEFVITVDNDELDLINFSSVSNIVRLIEKKVETKV